jgi:hypothetical protein
VECRQTNHGSFSKTSLTVEWWAGRGAGECVPRLCRNPSIHPCRASHQHTPILSVHESVFGLQTRRQCNTKSKHSFTAQQSQGQHKLLYFLMLKMQLSLLVLLAVSLAATAAAECLPGDLPCFCTQAGGEWRPLKDPLKPVCTYKFQQNVNGRGEHLLEWRCTVRDLGALCPCTTPALRSTSTPCTGADFSFPQSPGKGVCVASSGTACRVGRLPADTLSAGTPSHVCSCPSPLPPCASAAVSYCQCLSSRHHPLLQRVPASRLQVRPALPGMDAHPRRVLGHNG